MYFGMVVISLVLLSVLFVKFEIINDKTDSEVILGSLFIIVVLSLLWFISLPVLLGLHLGGITKKWIPQK